jgi:hypothetical protein
MLIKVLKSGLYAHPEPCKGVLALRSGIVMPADNDLAKAMIVDKWGEWMEVTKLTKSELVSLGACEDLTKQEMIKTLGLS